MKIMSKTMLALASIAIAASTTISTAPNAHALSSTSLLSSIGVLNSTDTWSKVDENNNYVAKVSAFSEGDKITYHVIPTKKGVLSPAESLSAAAISASSKGTLSDNEASKARNDAIIREALALGLPLTLRESPVRKGGDETQYDE